MSESGLQEARVLKALRVLAENDRWMGITAVAEARIIDAFRTRRRKRAFPWMAVCAVPIAAALATVIIVHRQHEPVNRVAPPVIGLANAVIAPSRDAPVAARNVSGQALQRTIPKRDHKTIRTEERRTEEIVTDFFPLMDPAPPFSSGQILRVQLPAAAMQAVGLPVGDDHLADQVQADVLVGEEGLPRAIRFIKFERQ